MRYRTLGKTGLEVSEIGFGPEWMDGTPEQTREIAEVLCEAGVNYMDCWMADPHIRENLGFAMRGARGRVDRPGAHWLVLGGRPVQA